MASTTNERLRLARCIDAVRVAEDRSVLWSAKRTGIAPSSLRRKLAGEVDFYLWEVAKLATAFNRRVSDFTEADAESVDSAATLNSKVA